HDALPISEARDGQREPALMAAGADALHTARYQRFERDALAFDDAGRADLVEAGLGPAAVGELAVPLELAGPALVRRLHGQLADQLAVQVEDLHDHIRGACRHVDAPAQLALRRQPRL